MVGAAGLSSPIAGRVVWNGQGEMNFDTQAVWQPVRQLWRWAVRGSRMLCWKLRLMPPQEHLCPDAFLLHIRASRPADGT